MCITIAYKDTDWNRERVRRNLTHEVIAKKFHVSTSTASRWFSGALMPTTDEIAELCRWFTELDPEHKIDFEMGKLFFEEISNKYVAERTRTVIMVNGKVQKKKESHRRGKTPKTEIGKVLWRKGITFEELSEKTGLGKNLLKTRFQGIRMPSDSEIILICDAIEYDIEKAEELFRQAYNERHEVDGQIDISEAKEIEEQPFEIAEPEVTKEPNERGRTFDLWFFALRDRVEPAVLVRILHAYVNFDYNMKDALEHIFNNGDSEGHLSFDTWLTIISVYRINAIWDDAALEVIS